MAKSFKVQINPTFKSAVSIPRIGGDPLAVTFEFKAMDRVALARMFDKWKAESIELMEEAAERELAGKGFTLEEWAEREIPLQVKQVKDITVGWGFSDEFSDENIEALLTTSVSVTETILSVYNDAYTRARQGN